MSNPPDIVQMQYRQGRINKNLFSLCFGHNGGFFTIGDYDTSIQFPESKVETFKFYPNAGQYKIPMIKIQVFAC